MNKVDGARGDLAGLTGVRRKIIFFGNGPLADFALEVLERGCEVIFHARRKEDLEKAVELKREFPEAIGVLASFGVLIPSAVLEVFEPEGILNIHPSLLPRFRGASPIESAILAGDNDFGVSVMKLAKAMDAGPIYYQTTVSGIPLEKTAIYRGLATAGAEWIVTHLGNLPETTPQDEKKATFCGKIAKNDGILTPATEVRDLVLRKIVAFQGWPKAKFAFYGHSCIILEAHVPEVGERAVLNLECLDGPLAVDVLQPEGRKAMSAQAFLNGYGK